MKSNLYRIILAAALLITTQNYISLLNFDAKVFQLLRKQNYSNSLVTEIMNGVPYYIPTESVLVRLYTENLDTCENLSIYSKKLLDMNHRSVQAYFILAACMEKSGRLESALREIKTALVYDPKNTSLLINKAILELNLGDLDLSQKTLNHIFEIDPNSKNLEEVQKALNFKLNI